MLDSIVSRWTVSIWRRFRPWFPWAAAVMLAVAVAAASTWRKDPIVELTELGWRVEQNEKGQSLGSVEDAPKGSGQAIESLHRRLLVRLHSPKRLDESVSELRNAKNLTTLYLDRTRVSDVSPLKELTNLTTLNLNSTRVSDVSPLKELKNLTHLDLSSPWRNSVFLSGGAYI